MEREWIKKLIISTNQEDNLGQWFLTGGTSAPMGSTEGFLGFHGQANGLAQLKRSKHDLGSIYFFIFNLCNLKLPNWAEISWLHMSLQRKKKENSYG